MRSVTSRNVWGGFWGGVLGIMAFAWYPLLLPVGCFGGVILGFWYGELALGVLARLRASHRRLERAIAIAGSGAAVVSRLGGVLPRVAATFLVIAGRCRMAAGASAAAVATAVGAMWRWLGAHPMNRADVVSVFAVVVFLVINVAWLIPTRGQEETIWRYRQLVPIIWMITGCAILVRLIPRFGGSGNVLDDMAAYYRRYALWAAYGPVPFFLRDLIVLLGAQIFVAVVFVLALAGVVAGGTVLTLVFGLSLATALACEFIRLALRRNHWLCFFVTLAVTAVSAWVSRPYVEGAYLWLVAVATGSVAGALTEVLRRAMTAFLERYPAMATFLRQPFHDILDASFSGMFGALGRSLMRLYMMYQRAIERPWVIKRLTAITY